MPDEREPAGSHHLRANEQVRAGSGGGASASGGFFHQFPTSKPTCELATGASHSARGNRVQEAKLK